MKAEFVPYDKNHYATNLQRTFDNRLLKWDSSPSQDVLLVKSAFGKNANTLKEEITEGLSALKRLPERTFTEISEGVWARFVPALEYAQNYGCPIDGVGCRYTIFAIFVNRDEERAMIFESSNQIMIKNYCDITVKGTVTVTRHVAEKGLFRRKVETDFWRISVSEELLDGYADGDMYYTLQNMNIPITREMAVRDAFFVRSALTPEFGVNNPGIELEVLR